MSPKIRAVFVKELRDALRDRRTVFATVVIPLVLYPVMMLLMAEATMMARHKLENLTHDVAIPMGMTAFFDDELKKLPVDEKSDDDVPRKVLQGMSKGAKDAKDGNEKKAPSPSLKFTEMTPESADKALTAGTIRAIVILESDFKSLVEAKKDVKIEVKYDQAEQRSLDAASRVRTLFERYRKKVVDERLTKSGLDHTTLEPFSISTTNVAQATKVGGSILGSFLPLLFIMMLIMGAMHPAIDMTAGEKERSTLETLIGAPVRPIEIITGKFLAVATLALGNATLNVANFALTFSMMPLAKMGGFEFPWAALPLTLLLLLPLALFFSALLLAVASFAANQKEAQIFCLPIYLIPVLGMTVVMMPGIELEGPLLLAPVINTGLLIKELFLSHGTAKDVAFVFFSTCLYAAGAVALAARIFAREEVLFSAQGSLRLFLSRKFFKPASTPKPGDALLLAALLFPINFYFQGYLQKMLLDPETGVTPGALGLMLGVPIWLAFGALPILVAWYLKLDLKRTFLWRTPSLRAVVGAVLLGCGTWLIAQQLFALQSHFWDFSAGDMEILEKPLREMQKSPGGIALLIFLMGITPGFCEESFFRGFLQQGITRNNKWLALVTVGVIFGAYHFPLWRQPIVMMLGIVMAYVAYETASIWPGMIYHALYNSMTVVMPMILGGGDQKPPPPGQPLPNIEPQYLAISVVLFVLGILMVRKSRRVSTENSPKPSAPSRPQHPVIVPSTAGESA